jgi:hypothetical protein
MANPERKTSLLWAPGEGIKAVTQSEVRLAAGLPKPVEQLSLLSDYDKQLLHLGAIMLDGANKAAEQEEPTPPVA